MNSKQNRWVILKHVGAPGDIDCFHFDLLLEDDKNCKTWRLEHFPCPDGPAVKSKPLSPHRLQWLDIKKSVVSGGRGVAYRMAAGNFSGKLSGSGLPGSLLQLTISWDGLFFLLEINENNCCIRTKNNFIAERI